MNKMEIRPDILKYALDQILKDKNSSNPDGYVYLFETKLNSSESNILRAIGFKILHQYTNDYNGEYVIHNKSLFNYSIDDLNAESYTKKKLRDHNKLMSLKMNHKDIIGLVSWVRTKQRSHLSDEELLFDYLNKQQ